MKSAARGEVGVVGLLVVASDTAGLGPRCANAATDDENGRVNVDEVSREVRPRSDARNAISYMFLCQKRSFAYLGHGSPFTTPPPGTQVRFGQLLAMPLYLKCTQ